MKNVITTVLLMSVLCLSTAVMAKEVNTIDIVLSADHSMGYAEPKNAVIDADVGKIRFNLFEEVDGARLSLEDKDFDIDVIFVEPTASPYLSCKRLMKWQDTKPSKLKRGKRYFKIKANKHRDGDCYTYDLIVTTDKGPILIDPRLIIKR